MPAVSVSEQHIEFLYVSPRENFINSNTTFVIKTKLKFVQFQTNIIWQNGIAVKYKNIFPEITVHPLIPNDFYDHKTVGEKFIQFAREALKSAS